MVESWSGDQRATVRGGNQSKGVVIVNRTPSELATKGGRSWEVQKKDNKPLPLPGKKRDKDVTVTKTPASAAGIVCRKSAENDKEVGESFRRNKVYSWKSGHNVNVKKVLHQTSKEYI